MRFGRLMEVCERLRRVGKRCGECSFGVPQLFSSCGLRATATAPNHSARWQ
jgi:hypothetical protein